MESCACEIPSCLHPMYGGYRRMPAFAVDIPAVAMARTTTANMQPRAFDGRGRDAAIPDEVLVLIFAALSVRASWLCGAMAVSRRWRGCAIDDALWQPLHERVFGATDAVAERRHPFVLWYDRFKFAAQAYRRAMAQVQTQTQTQTEMEMEMGMGMHAGEGATLRHRPPSIASGWKTRLAGVEWALGGGYIAAASTIAAAGRLRAEDEDEVTPPEGSGGARHGPVRTKDVERSWKEANRLLIEAVERADTRAIDFLLWPQLRPTPSNWFWLDVRQAIHLENASPSHFCPFGRPDYIALAEAALRSGSVPMVDTVWGWVGLDDGYADDTASWKFMSGLRVKIWGETSIVSVVSLLECALMVSTIEIVSKVVEKWLSRPRMDVLCALALRDNIPPRFVETAVSLLVAKWPRAFRGDPCESSMRPPFPAVVQKRLAALGRAKTRKIPDQPSPLDVLLARGLIDAADEMLRAAPEYIATYWASQAFDRYPSYLPCADVPASVRVVRMLADYASDESKARIGSLLDMPRSPMPALALACTISRKFFKVLRVSLASLRGYGCNRGAILTCVVCHVAERVMDAGAAGSPDHAFLSAALEARRFAPLLARWLDKAPEDVVSDPRRVVDEVVRLLVGDYIFC
jgi:hypothetical protein